MENAEIKLVKAAMAGNRDAFEKLVKLRFSLVYAIAYTQLADRQIAEDLAQEVFLRVYLHLDSLKSPEKFTPWLARITRNLATSWQRSSKRASLLLEKVIIENLEWCVVSKSTHHLPCKEYKLFLWRTIWKKPS